MFLFPDATAHVADGVMSPILRGVLRGCLMFSADVWVSFGRSFHTAFCNSHRALMLECDWQVSECPHQCVRASVCVCGCGCVCVCACGCGCGCGCVCVLGFSICIHVCCDAKASFGFSCHYRVCLLLQCCCFSSHFDSACSWSFFCFGK